MITGTKEFAELRALLDYDDDAAHVLALLRLTEDGWRHRNLWALFGLESPHWTEQTWRYAEVAAGASERSWDLLLPQYRGSG